MRNPYSSSNPATGPGFFNRISLLNEVVSTFVSFNPPEPFLIIGDRRSGKTSLLKTIADELTQKQNKAMGKIVLPVYVDMELFTPKTEMAFYLACIRSLTEVLALDSRNLIDLFYSFSHSGDSPIFGFIKTIRETVTRSQNTRRIERIAILVDEFDAHLKWIDTDGFLELTQHIRAALMDESIPLAMVLAGSTKAYVVSEFGGSPLYAITRHRVLEPFEWKDALALMIEPRKESELEFSFSKDDMRLIWELTGGHPFLIQRMMHHICELLIKRAINRVNQLVSGDGGDFFPSEHQLSRAIREETVTESDLRFAESSLAEDFKKWYDKMEEPVRRVYQQIAASVPDQGISHRSLRLLNLEAVEDSYLEERLTTLRSIGIIREVRSLDQSKRFVISGQAFRKWFFSQTGATTVPTEVMTRGSRYSSSDLPRDARQMWDLLWPLWNARMSLNLTEVQERQLRTIVYALETNITNYDHAKQESALISSVFVDGKYNDARRALWSTVEEARVLCREIRIGYPDVATVVANSDVKEVEDGRVCVLFLAANPIDSPRLALEEEVRGIDKVLRESGYRDQFDFRQQWAVRPQELQGYLLRYKPAIVHFSGHGTTAGEILLQNDAGKMEPVSVQILNELFANFDNTVRCVVLNACFSEIQSQVMANHIDCVIGMSDAMGDSAAQAFSTAFYQAIGWGKDIKTAFDLGCNQIRLLKLSDPSVPRLLARKRDPRMIIIAKPG